MHLSGFTIALYEWEPTVATLWNAVKGICLYYHGIVKYYIDAVAEFITENSQYLAPNNSMDFLSDNGGETYNLCHCKKNTFRRHLLMLK